MANLPPKSTKPSIVTSGKQTGQESNPRAIAAYPKLEQLIKEMRELVTAAGVIHEEEDGASERDHFYFIIAIREAADGLRELDKWTMNNS